MASARRMIGANACALSSNSPNSRDTCTGVGPVPAEIGLGRVGHDADTGRRQDRAEHDGADELPVIGPVIPVADLGVVVPVLVPIIIIIGPVLVPVIVVVVIAPILIIFVFSIGVLAPVLVVVVLPFVPVLMLVVVADNDPSVVDSDHAMRDGGEA